MKEAFFASGSGKCREKVVVPHLYFVSDCPILLSVQRIAIMRLSATLSMTPELRPCRFDYWGTFPEKSISRGSQMSAFGSAMWGIQPPCIFGFF